MNPGSRLSRQISFLLEIDKLKGVFRQTWLIDQSRRENDAEHSWHVAVMGLLLSEHSDRQDLDMLRVLKMLLVHDLVEIDAGDTFAYDEAGGRDKDQRERQAAERVFGLLPPDQATELRRLWDEFEERSTPEARYATALDRLQPLLHNYFTRGKAWQQHGVTSEMVLARNRCLADDTPALWQYVQDLVHDAVAKGYLAE